MSPGPLLSVSSLRRTVDGRVLWRDISFNVDKGDVIFVRGPSGSGKTLLLRALAALDPLEEGCLRLQGQTPCQTGIPQWRTRVAYVHQSRVNYKGTPFDLFDCARQFCAQRKRPHGDLGALVEELGMPASVCSQPWSELSGGQAQRVSLAISIALGPELLLLDEPTSACDAEAVARVEHVLKSCGAALIWVTHDNSQPARVGGKQLLVTTGSLSAITSSRASSSVSLSGATMGSDITGVEVEAEEAASAQGAADMV